MKYVPIGPRQVSGRFARVMSSEEYDTILATGTLGGGRNGYIPAFPITDISVLGNSRQIKERAREIGIDRADVLAIFSVSDGEAIYGPRQKIGGREVRIKAGTSVELLDKVNCR